jgi:hypothetical protein
MALDLLKKFIRDTAPVDVLEERALLLAGEPQDTIEFGIAAFCAELRAGWKGRRPDRNQARECN